jgi:hypothetical protein
LEQDNFRFVVRLFNFPASAPRAFITPKISGFGFEIALTNKDESTLQTTKGGSGNVSAFLYCKRNLFLQTCILRIALFE